MSTEQYDRIKITPYAAGTKYGEETAVRMPGTRHVWRHELCL